ncbi:hypothetical protein [Moorena producens]|uniref:hypothetical protein n=1 Tax=Moorena producens TaxID=1155739 RepID=UPI003C753BFA
MADLTGTWLGTYWQGGVPTRFEATLVQSKNTITGNSLDDGYLGEAQLTGEVIGRRIQFTKRYLSSSSTPIQYIGTLAESEDFINGQWIIDKYNTGPWEARRSGNDLLADLNTRLSERMPVAVP